MHFAECTTWKQNALIPRQPRDGAILVQLVLAVPVYEMTEAELVSVGVDAGVDGLVVILLGGH